MTQFLMNERVQASQVESDFVLGFIEAMFFTESATGTYSDEWHTDEVQEDLAEGRLDGCLPADMGYSDIHPDSLAKIRKDCEAFESEYADLLERAYSRGDYDAAQAGRDYWFTRNGHGVGFWDRKELAKDGLGDALSEACRYREVHPFFGDHVEYGDAPFIHVDI